MISRKAPIFQVVVCIVKDDMRVGAAKAERINRHPTQPRHGPRDAFSWDLD